MESLKIWFRDFIRGYNEDDVKSLIEKKKDDTKPFHIMTKGEFNALKDPRVWFDYTINNNGRYHAESQ